MHFCLPPKNKTHVANVAVEFEKTQKKQDERLTDVLNTVQEILFVSQKVSGKECLNCGFDKLFTLRTVVKVRSTV